MWLVATPLLFTLTTVSVVQDDTPVAGAQVCWSAAGDRENPFERWLKPGDVFCTAATEGIDFPAGLWNVYAETANAVSLPTLVDGDQEPSSITLEVSPATKLVTTSASELSAVAYVSRLAAALPIRGDTTLVPANEETWLFVFNRGKPVALLPVAASAAGTEVRVDLTSPAPWSVVAAVSVPPTHRAAIERARGLSPPTLRAISADETRNSDPLPDVSRLHGAFVRIRDVPPGAAELRLGGRGWVADRVPSTVSSALTLVEHPLVARAAGSLIVRWNKQSDLAEIEQGLTACGEDSVGPRLELEISSCAPPLRPNTPPDPKTCEVMRVEPLDMDAPFGVVRFDDLAPGVYRAVARYGNLPAPSGSTTVAPLEQPNVTLSLEYDEAYGNLTYDGEPLRDDAIVRLPGGYGFSVRGSGEYRAALLRPRLPGVDAQISVEPCDGGGPFVVLADAAMRPNTRFDIDIPANRLEVVVTDTFTRELLEGAQVRVEVLSLRVPKRPVITRTMKTGAGEDAGRITVTSLPERETLVSVSLPGYQKSAVERFTMGRRDEKRLEIQLVPLRGNRGRVVSSRPFDDAAVFWYLPDGRESERTDIAADGTFIYASPHEANETMIVVSRSHPLWVTRSPAVERHADIIVRFPDVAGRSFDIARRTHDLRAVMPIALAIGGLRVPHALVRLHQSLRDLPGEVRGAGPMRVADIIESGPIDVFGGASQSGIRLTGATVTFD
ncbi:MAG TPA: hypothetical protein VF057_04835 [Thermoanaerobaculia bacterium]